MTFFRACGDLAFLPFLFRVPVRKEPSRSHAPCGALPLTTGLSQHAVNVSTDASLTSDGDKTIASLEQILVWDPEVIICNEAGVDDEILEDPRFAGVNAVRNGRAYQIPVGVTRYGHPNSIETPLAVYWLAKTLYPYLFDYRIEDKIKEFYLEFFDYEVSDETVAAILKGDDIRDNNQNPR